ncbi:MAG: C39 family peptidase [Candidatus Yanofskybacteria bacterium]|nr:C39 family peptidase [Candidatus Yanofskybacteria bacterium]
MKKYILFATIFILAVFAFISFKHLFWPTFSDFVKKQSLPEETRIVITQTPLVSPSGTIIDFAGINLAVPFSPQAPYADWSLPYQESCEETSAILVDKFYKNETITPEIADKEILKLVEWQKKRFGYYFHTTAKETSIMLREYFGYKKVDVLNDISIETIKSHILAGRPVIVPLAGQMAGNPYYRQPGPVYHMLVIKGVTKDGDFITNDVGTKRGQNYVYDDEVLFNAIHDAPTGGDGWDVANPEEYVKTGRKTIVVVYPN